MSEFDNQAFTVWLADFEESMIECGMPQPQAMKFRGKYYQDAVSRFLKGESPDDAAVNEVMGIA